MVTKLSIKDFIQKLQAEKYSELTPELKEYKEKVLTINENLEPRNLFLYTPDKGRINKAKEQLVTLYKVMSKLIFYIIHKEPELLKFLGKEGIDYEALKKKHPDTLLGYARVDTIFGKDEFRVVEFNSRRPQMYEDADFYNEYLSEKVESSNIIKEDNGLHLMKSIQTQFEANLKKTTPETIVVLNNFPNQSYSFSSISRIKKYFNNSNILVFKCNNIKDFYEGCQFESGSLTYDNQKVDLIILQSVCGKNSLYTNTGKLRIKAIAEAYHANAIELYTSPSGQISGTKLSLDLLQNKEIQDKLNLSEKERYCINLIPRSVHSLNISNIKDFNKDDYVLKLTGLGQGQGVKMGVNMSEQEWVDNFNKYKILQKDFLIQEKIDLTEEDIFDLQTLKYRKAYITLEPFVINDLSTSNDPYISGYATRAIPVEKYISGMKFNPAYNNTNIYFGAVLEEI